MERLAIISWPAVIAIIILACLLAYYCTQSERGRQFIQRYAPWKESTWRTILFIAFITLLLLIAPIANGILLVFAALVYLLFRNNESQTSQTLSKRLGFGERKKAGHAVDIYCHMEEATDFSEMKLGLQRRLFSCPYLHVEPSPTLRFDGKGYQVSTKLSGEEYVSSFVHYLQQHGYTVTLK